MIKTTVIGSYPVNLDGAGYAKAYFMGEEASAAKEAIRQAVSKMVDAGIDIIADGQTRGDFINIFAKNFRGAVIQKRPVVVGELEYADYSTVDDQVFVKGVIGDSVKLKGVITGPYTMAKGSENRYYDSIKELSFAYAKGLRKEAEKLAEVVDYIQVDEPFFSVDYPDYAKEVVEEVFGNVKAKRLLHVCGDVSGVFDKVVDFKVDVLEHEFAANPHLWDTVSEISFSQDVGVGVVRSDINTVEDISEIKARMEKALTYLPPERLFFNPDCGLRNLSADVAYQKLENMTQARDTVCV